MGRKKKEIDEMFRMFRLASLYFMGGSVLLLVLGISTFSECLLGLILGWLILIYSKLVERDG